MPSRNFVSTAELAAELGDPDLGVIDASWHLPNAGRTGAGGFRLKNIPPPGGLPKWIKEGRLLETGDAHPKPRVFTPRLEDHFVASLDEVRAALASGSAQVVDARPAERFGGAAPEPRPGVKSSRMPGSLNLPFVDILEHGA